MTAADSITLSVIVLNYNNGPFIVDCLSSIERQGVDNYEVLIIDDCSTDNSVRLIREYIKDKEKFFLLEKEKNTGGASSLNMGITRSRGKYLAIVDSDDVVADRAYYHLIQRIDQDGSDIAAGLPMKLFDGLVCAALPHERQLKQFAADRVITSDKEKGSFCNQVFCWNCVYRTGFLKENSIGMPDGLLIADRVFLYSAVYKAKSISLDHHIVYYWRRLSSSEKQSITDRQKEYKVIADRCDSFEAQIRVTLENADTESSQLHRYIWENSIERLFYPLSALLDSECIEKDYIARICDRYRLLLSEYAGFFNQLIEAGAIKSEYAFFIISIVEGKYNQLYDMSRMTNLKRINMKIAQQQQQFTIVRAGTEGGRVFLYAQLNAHDSYRNGQYIEKILAVSRFYGQRVFSLEYDRDRNRFDITDLPKTTYNFLAVGHNNSESFLVECAKDLRAPVNVFYQTKDIVVSNSKSGGNPFSILQKNRYAFINDKTELLLFVSQQTEGLFFYNTEKNRKTELEQIRDGVYKIDREALHDGNHVLIDQISPGVYSAVFKQQFSNSYLTMLKNDSLFENSRIEIRK